MRAGLMCCAIMVSAVASSGVMAGGLDYRFALASTGKNSVPVSATPFDPTSLPQDRFFGRQQFSSRAVAIDIILTAARVRDNDSLVYRPRVATGRRLTTRWRLRASRRRLQVRYEIRF